MDMSIQCPVTQSRPTVWDGSWRLRIGLDVLASGRTLMR